METPQFLETQINLSPKAASDPEEILIKSSRSAGIHRGQVKSVQIIRRSIDSRRKPVRISLMVRLILSKDYKQPERRIFHSQNVQSGKEVVVVGAGPAGLFAALRLIELGLKPIILERGKKVSERKADIAILNRNKGLNPDSNYCFGEGGAGTFSDGKLYTRSKKRGEIQEMMELLVHFGAKEEILVDAHPHIGSDKLPVIIENMRQAIIDAGGYFGFNSVVDNIEVVSDRVVSISTKNGDSFKNLPVILATGHSSRDIYELLKRKKVLMEAKGFAMGVRVEHPQELINQIQYHSKEGRGEFLPAAEYSISAQINKRGVYSFCMCPGGTIVPSSTALGEMVVNGMSNSRRSSPFANSGIVVEIRESDLRRFQAHGVMAGVMFQNELESLAFKNGGEDFTAPAQRISDFIRRKTSSSLPKSSYNPGLISSAIHKWLPDEIGPRLSQAFKNFNNRMQGYASNEAILVGVESRTSSPLRIPRRSDTFEHISVAGLYPCGEGAGYAGGIISSALDGYLCAEALAKSYSV